MFSRIEKLSAIRIPAALALVVVAAGCSLAPQYERPELPVSAVYPNGGGDGAMASSTAQSPVAAISWRQFFRDPVLQELIERALANNRDLRQAVLTVEEARSRYRIQRGELAPQLAMAAQGTGQRLPADLGNTGVATTSHDYQVAATVAWEIDLWGRVRSLNEQAMQSYLALDESRAAAELTLVSAVANGYLTLRADQELLNLTRQTLATRHRALTLTRLLVEAGSANQLDLNRAEIALRTAEAKLAIHRRHVDQDRNALQLLVGEPLTAALSRQLDAAVTLPETVLQHELPVGLPSELLARRPDVRAAEHQLRAANASIGAARAAFWPSVSLTGAAGTASASLDGLFEGGSGSWLFSPQIRLPLFNGGALQASLDVATLRKRMEVANYEQTIQTAFREVADGLAGKRALDQQLQAEQQLVAASYNAYVLAEQRFNEGLDDSLSLLDAQRSLFDAQQALVSTRLARATNLINLYKALGGGWSEHLPMQADAVATTMRSSSERGDG